MTRRSEDHDRHATTRGERRDHARTQRSDLNRQKNPNYRSGREHPDFSSEVAKGQQLLDDWVSSLRTADKGPRSR